MRKFSIVSLMMLLFLCVFLNGTSVRADENNVSSVGGGIANYYVDEVVEDVELDFGVKYHNDAAYLNTTNPEYIAAGSYAAGGSSYGKEEFVVGKYYTANVNVLEVPSNEEVQVIPYANIKNGKWTLTTVAGMISNYEATHPSKRVIAAVNGDFFDISANGNYPYTSTGGTVSEGNYFKVNSAWNSIAFMNNGSTKSLVGNILPQVSAKPVLQIMENGEVVYEVNVDALNEAPATGETTAYFTFYDNNHNPEAVEVSNAYIVTGSQIAPYSKNSVYGLGEIEAIGNAKLNVNQFAISTTNSVLREYLKEGVTVRIQYEYVGELEGVDNVVGYEANIILDGEAQLFRNYRHPRTMVGVREDGTIIFTTIDGRQISKGYYGASPVEQAALMQYYGCVQAYNLDGGGSTTIIIRQNGKFVVKNSPSDGNERSDGNCILIVADVPSINIETLNVTQNSFDIKIDVIEMIDKYKDLYIAVNGEKRKVTNEAMTFSGLNIYTEYVYKLYALVDGEYIGLPYADVVNTAKGMFEVDSAILEKVVKDDGKEYYRFAFTVTDEYSTIMMLGLRIDGNRVSVSNGEAYILVEDGMPLSELCISISYDLADGNGRTEALIKTFNLTIDSTETLVVSIFDSIDTIFDRLLSE